MTVALQGISGRGAKRDLNPPGGKPRSQHLTAVGASLLARSVGGQRRSPKGGRLINQSQLAVPLSCGLTTSIGNNFARAIAEREAHECKTQSYSNI